MTHSTCPVCSASLEDATGLCARCLLESAMTQPTPTPDLIPSPLDLAADFPDYELQVVLGQGGMGTVYRARQTKLDRLVALKVLRPELSGDPEFAERFVREAQALARLDHPGIVRVHDFGEAGDSLYLAMEFVDGASLRDLLQEGRLTSRDALAYVPQICDALQYAHDQSVVHRDVKPENLLVDQAGRVRIADFGLAKLLDQREGPAPVTVTRQALGTPHYMAPEQVSGAGAVDHRADLYSLGVVLYELLTGELPLGRFAPPSATDATHRPFDPLVMKSLEPDPAARYQAADELKEDLPRTAAPAPRQTPARKASLVAPPTLQPMDLGVAGLVLLGSFMPWMHTPLTGGATAWEVQIETIPMWAIACTTLGVVGIRWARAKGHRISVAADLWAIGAAYVLTTCWILLWLVGPSSSNEASLLHGSMGARGSTPSGGSGAYLTWIALGAWVLPLVFPRLRDARARRRSRAKPLKTALRESRARRRARRTPTR